MGSTIWDVIVAGMKFWSHEKTVTAPSANTESITNITNKAQSINNAIHTTIQAYTFNNNTSVFKQILPHQSENLARIIYFITVLMTMFGTLAGMIRTIIRYCKRNKVLQQTNVHEIETTTVKVRHKAKQPINSTNQHTKIVTQINNHRTHAIASFYLKNTVFEEYKKKSNIVIWINKVENFCSTYFLDRLRISKENMREENLENIKSLTKQDKTNKIMDHYNEIKEATIELFKIDKNQNSNDRKQLKNERTIFFYAELCNLAEDALLELHEKARIKRIKTQFLTIITKTETHENQFIGK
jgi:hypothetical protein